MAKPSKNNKVLLKMKVEKVKISEVKPNPKNPRVIRDEKFKKLVQSLQEFPEMMELRPIVIDELGVVLGGNMRLKAAKEAGLESVWVCRVELPEEKKKEFLVKDNINYGKWDYLLLKDYDALEEWGMDVPEWFKATVEQEEEEDDFFSDFDQSESNSRGEEAPELKSETTTTYFLLNYPIEDAEFLQKMEKEILKKTESEDMSSAIYKIIKKNG